jgi:hypothetical protein
MCIQPPSIICLYAYGVRRHAYVSDACNKNVSLLIVYSHSETNENPAQKIKNSLSAKRSTLKPRNSKTFSMPPAFLNDFLTLFKVEIKNTLLKKRH